MLSSPNADLGVVIVTYNSEDVIRDCLERLAGSDYHKMYIVVVDNASSDNTIDVVRNWAQGSGGLAETDAKDSSISPLATSERTILIRSGVNTGYAGGANTGLRYLLRSPSIELFWILNPDCRVLPDTASKFVACAKAVGTFGLMGGRVVYIHPENTIQSDGGQINRWSGMCKNINLSKDARTTPYPNRNACDFVSGASIVASRTFLGKVGLMREDYFLYYEEVDWAFRRDGLDLVYAEGAIVHHHAGTAIGSPVVGNEQGTAFSNYFNYRNRMRFMRRFFPTRIPVAYVYSLLKIIRLVMQGHYCEAEGAFRGLHRLAPPESVSSRLSREAYHLWRM